MKPIRVLLADDHRLVRAGIRALLEGLPGIQVVAETNDGRDALRLIKAHQPAIVLMDISMPGLNGLDATTRVATECPNTRVLILSVHANEEYVREALRCGAAGYLLKSSVVAELELAIKSVALGEMYLSPHVAKNILQDYLGREAGERTSVKPLTRRQRQVLQLIAQGSTTKAIAQALSLSVKTIESHRTQLMQRLDIHDVVGLVRYAIRIGLVELDR